MKQDNTSKKLVKPLGVCTGILNELAILLSLLEQWQFSMCYCATQYLLLPANLFVTDLIELVSRALLA